jgi:hypothetical protein
MAKRKRQTTIYKPGYFRSDEADISFVLDIRS